MKKLVRLFSVLALASTVAFTSCTGDTGPQGPVGPQGPAGQNGSNGSDGSDGVDGVDGKDGNANVKSFTATVGAADWTATEVPGIGTGSTSTWGTAQVSDALVTSDKAVLAYLVSGDFKYSLPISLSKEIDSSVESLQFSYGTGVVNLYYKSQTQLFGGNTSYAPTSDLSFKFVVIEETQEAALKSAGVDVSDYEQVVNYLNRSVTVPTQL